MIAEHPHFAAQKTEEAEQQRVSDPHAHTGDSKRAPLNHVTFNDAKRTQPDRH